MTTVLALAALLQAQDILAPGSRLATFGDQAYGLSLPQVILSNCAVTSVSFLSEDSLAISYIEFPSSSALRQFTKERWQRMDAKAPSTKVKVALWDDRRHRLRQIADLEGVDGRIQAFGFGTLDLVAFLIYQRGTSTSKVYRLSTLEPVPGFDNLGGVQHFGGPLAVVWYATPTEHGVDQVGGYQIITPKERIDVPQLGMVNVVGMTPDGTGLIIWGDRAGRVFDIASRKYTRTLTASELQKLVPDGPLDALGNVKLQSKLTMESYQEPSRRNLTFELPGRAWVSPQRTKLVTLDGRPCRFRTWSR
jgi:hypothetical protein